MFDNFFTLGRVLLTLGALGAILWIPPMIQDATEDIAQQTVNSIFDGSLGAALLD